MPSHLVVAHQTAASPELIATLHSIALEDPAAEFTLLVPATPVQRPTGTWDEDETRASAEGAAAQAATSIRAAGLNLGATRVGDKSPVAAVQDEMNLHPHSSIVVSTLPLGISAWVRLDAVAQIRARTDVPVTHVVSTTAPAPV